jgi:hypothetical protein
MQIRKASISNSCKSEQAQQSCNPFVTGFSSKLKEELPSKALKKGREITVILISDIDLQTHVKQEPS